jgi:hypothetical protein
MLLPCVLYAPCTQMYWRTLGIPRSPPPPSPVGGGTGTSLVQEQQQQQPSSSSSHTLQTGLVAAIALPIALVAALLVWAAAWVLQRRSKLQRGLAFDEVGPAG